MLRVLIIFSSVHNLFNLYISWALKAQLPLQCSGTNCKYSKLHVKTKINKTEFFIFAQEYTLSQHQKVVSKEHIQFHTDNKIASYKSSYI